MIVNKILIKYVNISENRGNKSNNRALLEYDAGIVVDFNILRRKSAPEVQNDTYNIINQKGMHHFFLIQ